MARFSKQHYEVLATALAAARPAALGYTDLKEAKGADDQFKTTLERVCDVLRADNPRFNSDTFVEWVMFDGPGRPGATPNGRKPSSAY
jgi:hypothetical protein